MVRVGSGFDAHRLAEGVPLVLGGVAIPFSHGLLGHSDGDALLHAIADALLGAAALGDMGEHFPSSDPAYRGARSTELLARAWSMATERGWSLVNLDATILAQRPALRGHLGAMRGVIAGLLRVPEGRVSIKAKSTDGLGAIGAGEGIAAAAVALLQEPP